MDKENHVAVKQQAVPVFVSKVRQDACVCTMHIMRSCI